MFEKKKKISWHSLLFRSEKAINLIPFYTL